MITFAEMHTRSSESQMNRGGTLKRKRRSSDHCSNIENEPVQEDKKMKEERHNSNEEEDLIIGDERLPLSELLILPDVDNELNDLNEKESDRYKSFSSPESQCDSYSVSPTPGSSGYGEFKNIIALSEDPSILEFDCKLLFNDRASPWPSILSKIDWANINEWWNHYVASDNETARQRNSRVFDNHPGLQPRMRAVLLEWLIEVCDVFKLHRETYYLTVDYLDRYLYNTSNIPKVQLQLIGISCLLIASKVEEIYPPKVAEYAFVTDGACTENDILKMEIIIIKVLNWKFKSITTNCWLLIYLQLGYMYIRKEKTFDCLQPSYPPELYVIAAQLLDLATLDITSLCYSYSVLAISALYIVCSEKFPLKVSGYQYHEIRDCIHWMEAFWSVISDKKEFNTSAYCPPQSSKRSYNDMKYFLQRHVVSIELLESALSVISQNQNSPPLNVLTPPPSSEKLGISDSIGGRS